MEIITLCCSNLDQETKKKSMLNIVSQIMQMLLSAFQPNNQNPNPESRSPESRIPESRISETHSSKPIIQNTNVFNTNIQETTYKSPSSQEKSPMLNLAPNLNSHSIINKSSPVFIKPSMIRPSTPKAGTSSSNAITPNHETHFVGFQSPVLEFSRNIK